MLPDNCNHTHPRSGDLVLAVSGIFFLLFSTTVAVAAQQAGAPPPAVLKEEAARQPAHDQGPVAPGSLGDEEPVDAEGADGSDRAGRDALGPDQRGMQLLEDEGKADLLGDWLQVQRMIDRTARKVAILEALSRAQEAQNKYAELVNQGKKDAVVGDSIDVATGVPGSGGVPADMGGDPFSGMFGYGEETPAADLSPKLLEVMGRRVRIGYGEDSYHLKKEDCLGAADKEYCLSKILSSSSVDMEVRTEDGNTEYVTLYLSGSGSSGSAVKTGRRGPDSSSTFKKTADIELP